MKTKLKTVAAAFMTAGALLASGAALAQSDEDKTLDTEGFGKPTLELAITDPQNKMMCYKANAGFACTDLRDGAMTKGVKIEDVMLGMNFIAHKITDIGANTACYSNKAGLWCAPLSDKIQVAGPTAPSVEVVEMGIDLGLVYRVKDKESGLVVYASTKGIAGTVLGEPDKDIEGRQVTIFQRADMQRIRDYDVGAMCFYAPNVSKMSFACAPLKETNDGSNQEHRVVLKLNDPSLQFSVLDYEGGVVAAVNNTAVCIAPWKPGNPNDASVEIKDTTHQVEGKTVERVVDQMLGMFGYHIPGSAFSCGNVGGPVVAPAAKPS